MILKDSGIFFSFHHQTFTFGEISNNHIYLSSMKIFKHWRYLLIDIPLNMIKELIWCLSWPILKIFLLLGWENCCCAVYLGQYSRYLIFSVAKGSLGQVDLLDCDFQKRGLLLLVLCVLGQDSKEIDTKIWQPIEYQASADRIFYCRPKQDKM